MEILQPLESNVDSSRAKEIDHGTIPLKMQNVILGLPSKPGLQFGDRSSVNAIKWAYEQIVSQKQLLTTVSIAKDISKPIFILENSWRAIQKIHFRNLTDLFFLKSWKWHLTFEFRSNFQQVGMASIVFVNAPQSAIPYLTGSPVSNVDGVLTSYDTPGKIGIPDSSVKLTHNLFSLSSAVQLPHTHVMLGEKQDVECTLNWISPFSSSFKQVNPYGDQSIYADSYPNPNDLQYDMGFIYLFVPIPMNYATGVDPNCTVRIWSHLTDVEYAGYTPDDRII